MEPVGVLIAQARDPALHAVEHSVFGTADPDRIARLLTRFCVARLGTPPAGASFYGSSVGCVIGLGLESGEDVVIKAYQRHWQFPFLAAVQEVQRRVAVGGLPCARPLLGPAPLSPDHETLAVVESWLPDPGMRAITSTRARRVSAAGLARQISLCDGLHGAEALRHHPLRTPPAALYPEPHSPHFDFEGSAKGAEWIDALARKAVAIRAGDVTRAVISHTDWSARNVRLDEERLLAVYDWDSVAKVEESTGVGQAALTWRVTAEPGGTTYPSADEVASFVRDYEDAAGHRLSAEQWRATGAAAAYTLAYTARCEHALEAARVSRPDPRAARDRLADDGQRLLGLEGAAR